MQIFRRSRYGGGSGIDRMVAATVSRRPSAAGVVATVIVVLATTLVALGPRWVIVDGRLEAERWLLLHPTALGVTDALGGLEAVGNLLLFVPLAAVVAMFARRRRLGAALVLIAPLPLLVEIAQRAIPGRVPDGGDVILNTAGLLVAFGGIALIRWAFGARADTERCEHGEVSSRPDRIELP